MISHPGCQLKQVIEKWNLASPYAPLQTTVELVAPVLVRLISNPNELDKIEAKFNLQGIKFISVFSDWGLITYKSKSPSILFRDYPVSLQSEKQALKVMFDRGVKSSRISYLGKDCEWIISVSLNLLGLIPSWLHSLTQKPIRLFPCKYITQIFVKNRSKSKNSCVLNVKLI